ncbi:MAG: protein kinase [Polyangiaceae bacterium]
MLPPRFEGLHQLGKGGGGEVWRVRDRLTGEVLALKALAEGSTSEESLALVREATALGALEGLGVPRVLRFGRLPSGVPYLVRELVEGESLAAVLERQEPARVALVAVVAAADQLTALHRAQLLHGDVKPANIIVREHTRPGDMDRPIASLVDLGLVTTLRERGTAPRGITPRYAAPELFEGAPLTVRGEIHALGATLRDVALALQAALSPEERGALESIVERAMNVRPELRFPSADELASAVRAACPWVGAPASTTAWPIVGLDATAQALMARLDGLSRGGGLVITGPRGSGRTTLLRRLAWSLGVVGRSVAWIEAGELAEPMRALEIEVLGAWGGSAPEADAPANIDILVDDVERLDERASAYLTTLRERGARLVVVATAAAQLAGPTFEVFAMPELAPEIARDLVLRAAPSLNDAAVARVIERAGSVPGRLRAILTSLRDVPVLGSEDVDRLAHDHEPRGGARDEARSGESDYVAIRSALERGHFEEAAERLEALTDERGLEIGILRARLASNRGEWRGAIRELLSVEEEASHAGDVLSAEFHLELARANLRAGDYAACEEAALRTVRPHLGEDIATRPEGLASKAPRRVLVAVAESAAIGGLGKSFLGKHAEATLWLEASVELARELGEDRTLSITLGSLAFALQRTSKLEPAEIAYKEALGHAEAANDAGTVATTRLNLAGVAKARGDIAAALEHLGAAVDMGRRSGRQSTLRQALLNLANLDLYLGRLSRAKVSITELAEGRSNLPPNLAAQLLSLEAEHAMKSGSFELAARLCDDCGAAYEPPRSARRRRRSASRASSRARRCSTTRRSRARSIGCA